MFVRSFFLGCSRFVVVFPLRVFYRVNFCFPQVLVAFM